MPKKLSKSASKVISLLLLLLLYHPINSVLHIDGYTHENTMYRLKNGEVQVHFIDVGQGDSILIETKDDFILIDTGPNTSEEKLRQYLKYHGVDKIEYVVLTHPDSDHIGGADMIIDEFNINKVMLSQQLSESKSYSRVIERIKDYGIETVIPKAADKFYVGSLTFTVLAPLEYEDDGTNDNCIVLRMDYGETSFMFMGDMSTDAEGQMLEKYPAYMLDCDVLKVGHHGSDTSTSVEFLNMATPSISVISCGKYNTYGHPFQEIVYRLKKSGSEVYRTDEMSDIVVSTGGLDESIEVKYNK